MRTGAWSGGSSPANLVAPGVWFEAWLSRDGLSQLELKLDGIGRSVRTAA
jgi:hypothetical protein